METRESSNPHYRAMVGPITADKRDMVIPAFGLKRKQIDLTSALNQERFQLKGDYIWADSDTSGVAVIRLNNTSEDPIPVRAENGFEGMPYSDIFITAAAQPGLVLNLWYGYGARFLSTASNISTLTSILNAVKIADYNGNTIDSLAQLGGVGAARRLVVAEAGYVPGVIFQSSANLVANTPENIIAAVSNVGGYVLHDAMFAGGTAGTTNLFSFLAKATAPATVVDGSVLAVGVISSVSAMISPQSISQKRLAAGLRLDRINGVLTSFNVAGAHYTLLP